jgi:hypothetical protein
MPNISPRILFLTAAIAGAFLFFGSAGPVLADACNDFTINRLNGVQSECTVGGVCNGVKESALFSILPALNQSPACPAIGVQGEECCLERGGALCTQAAHGSGIDRSGTCKASCSSAEISLRQLAGIPETCGGGSTCCVPKMPGDIVESGQGCIRQDVFPGVPSACKASAGTNEFVAGSGWDQYKLDCPPNQQCVITKGSALCKAIVEKMVKPVNPSGYLDYDCHKTSECSDEKAETTSVPGNSPCASGESCCKPKSGAAGGSAASGKTPAGTPKTLPDPLGGASIHSIIGNVIRTFAGIAGSIALIMFVYGGIMMIMSKGESGKVESARKILINSAIGIVLIFAAYTFVAAIIDAILAE